MKVYVVYVRSGHTRFRWLQDKVTLRGNVWALDNIYLGEGCPWMCSGHGRCVDNHCLYVPLLPSFILNTPAKNLLFCKSIVPICCSKST